MKWQSRFGLVKTMITLLGTLGMASALASLGTSPTAVSAGTTDAAFSPLARQTGNVPMAVTPPLSTPWTAQVGPNNALPEYPRPQMTRARWMNLNGTWDYTNGQTSEKILVPFPPESALSGIARRDERMVYRRNFEVPSDWRSQGQRVILHFGAVDQQAHVRVNGQTVATHEGGYTAFSADVTDALTDSGAQQLEVLAEDRNEAGDFPVGKQRGRPQGILYTGASGIWQTVWAEPVPAEHISNVDIRPDRAASEFAVTAHTGNADQRVEAVISEPGGREVGRAIGNANSELRVAVPNPRLWSPQDPFLYDVTVRLLRDSNTSDASADATDTAGSATAVDEVTSYAGMRSVELVRDEAGRPRIALNGQIQLHQGPLDQGYWPDGIYTAPTDAALRFDLEQTKRLGFNATRKHVKVEPARWYYWADRLGLLVWQDMPSLPVNFEIPPGEHPGPSEQAQTRYRRELEDMVGQLRHFPSLVAWVPFNEGWGEFDTADIARRVQELDPTRLVDASSGVNCCYSLPDSGAGDIIDDHTYVGPGKPSPDANRATADGEYGGLGLVENGHTWPGEPQAYEMTPDRPTLTRRYSEVSDDLAEVVRSHGLSAAFYTQITDVENEVNGLLTYDRRIVKPDAAVVAEKNRAAIDASRE